MVELAKHAAESSAGSASATPTTSRKEVKEATDEDPGKLVKIKELFPAVGPGMTPTKVDFDAAFKAADYYRNGGTKGYIENETSYSGLPARSFIGFDTDDKAASIRIYGRGPKGKDDKDLIPAYSKFFLESVQESHTERTQIVETFGDFYVFMFGEKPSVYSFSGQLVNSKNANWVTDFMLMYDLFLRGTKCVELDARAVLTYGGRQIEGFILNIATQTSAAMEGAVGISFQVLVTEKKLYGFSEDMGVFTDTTGKFQKTNQEFQKLMKEISANNGKGTSQPEVSTAIKAAKEVMAAEQPLVGPGEMIA